MKFEIDYATSTRVHIKALDARDRALLFDAIEKNLTYEPARESRNCKQLRNNPFASHELRVRNLRVFYRIDEEKGRVHIEAIGRKIRNKLLIGDEEVSL